MKWVGECGGLVGGLGGWMCRFRIWGSGCGNGEVIGWRGEVGVGRWLQGGMGGMGPGSWV